MTITSILRKVSNRAWAAAAVVTAVVAVPAGLMAWGPDRPTYTMQSPADHVTFNSITNATNYGDERNFVTISQDGKSWGDDITVANGQEYYVRIYVHNNAASNLNLVAQNVMARLAVPTQTANRIQVDGYVNSTNASPTSVWDQAVFHGANNASFKLDYVANSAYYKNAKGQFNLGDGIVGSGAKLGYDKMDGNIPGCFEYSGAVFLKVKAKTTDFNISKTVRKADTGSFTENATVNPGEKVDFQLYLKNTGGLNQTTVSIKDILPTGLTYVPDTTYVRDSQGLRKVNDGITAGGMTMGSYLPNGDVYVKFTAKVAANEALTVCGPNTLVNKMSATTAESGTKTDTATVTVNKTCTPPEKVKACNLKTFKIETVEKSKIDNVNYTLDLSKCEVKKVQACNLKTFKIETVEESKIDNINYTLDLKKCEVKKVEACNLKTMKIETVEESKIDNVNYTLDLEKCKKPEMVKACNLKTMKIETVEKSKIDGVNYTTDLTKCEVKKVKACNLETLKIETVEESKIDNVKYTLDLSKCEKKPETVQACDLKTKEIVTVEKSKIDNVNYTLDLTKCEEETTIKVCDLETKQIVTVKESEASNDRYTTDLSKCEKTPETPTELPHTGAAEGILSVLGLGSIVGVASAYIASRRLGDRKSVV